MKKLVVLASLALVGTVHAAKWNGSNDPTNFNFIAKAKMNASFAALPLAANLKDDRLGWSESYWPSMLGGVGLASHALPPTFADTARILSPSRIVERKDSALLGYEISQSQELPINQYLRQHISTRDFLRDVAVIIDGIYGSKVTRDIHVVEDVDTGTPIMELTILSGLPLNDEFDQKDQLLFQRIEASGLAGGLRDVVISQG